MDIFGFKTQGVNYDKFRPKYPQPFLKRCLKSVNNKNRYLDIATGTGQLLFAFASHFKQSKGIDISQTMLNSASQNLKQFKIKHSQTNVDLSLCGVMDLKPTSKYDFITVGQALHFFPIRDALTRIRSLMQNDGTFVTVGYIPKMVTSANKQEGQIFLRYEKQITPFYTFARQDLHTHYSNNNNKFPFEELFPKVERKIIKVGYQMNKTNYLNYLRTMSGYNLYLQKNKDDPAAEIQQFGAQVVTVWLDYFMIQCHLI